MMNCGFNRLVTLLLWLKKGFKILEMEEFQGVKVCCIDHY